MGVAPKKSLGQNFLVDRGKAEKIVESLDLQQGETILEIGPGEGALTGLLIERGARVIAVEIDHRAAAALREKYGDLLTIIEDDFLRIEPNRLLGSGDSGPVRVVGNIPYYITTPILFHLFDRREQIAEATLMMQREVAERLTAEPRKSMVSSR